MADKREEILNFVKEHGPVLPSHVAKASTLSILFASAYLSELADKKHIKISWIKVGGSPLYFAPGQEEKLEKYVENLNDKDKETFHLLKEKKLLKDSEQIPLTRVSLRNLRDFAVPIQINDELYWKFYNVTDDEIKRLFEKKETVKEKTIEKTKEEKQVTLESLTPVQEVKAEVQQQAEELETKPEITEQPKRKRGRPKKIVQEKPKEEKVEEKQLEIVKDKFIEEVEAFFSGHSIDVIESTLVKKGKEAEFIVMLPTPFGKTKYFCKAFNKKSINEGDVSSTVLRAHYKKLSGLLIAPGKLTKKAQEMLEKEAHGLLFKQL